MTKTHVLHITYDMNIGGTEQVIRNLVEGLPAESYKSSILCIDGNIGPWGEELAKKGIRHHCLKRAPGLDLSVIKGIRKLIKSEAIDIVHCHQYTPYIYGLFGAFFTRTPVIFTEHGRFYPDVSSFKRKAINPILQLRTNAITTISKATAKALQEFENFNLAKIEVIYNGIADNASPPDPSLKKSLNIAPDDIVLGTISRLDTIKNQTMMLHAFNKAVSLHPNIKLLIVGDGPLKQELHALTQELDLSHSVIYTGFQSNPQSYLAIIDIFLLPSLSEGTSMTLLEAMSFSKPSIATSVGGTPEIIINNTTGLLINNEDELGLVNAIDRLVKDPHARETYGNNARQEYERRFTIKSMSDQYQKLYRSLV